MSLEQSSGVIVDSPKKIVSVDDEVMISKLIEMNLKRAGYTVVPFSNPLLVLEYLKTNPMDILITDGMMPQMRGEDLAQKIRQLYPAMGRLLVSGTVSQHIQDQNLFDATLQKPFRSLQLLDAVDRAYINSQPRRSR
jgi:DNA-binding NtrC family response regulator